MYKSNINCVYLINVKNYVKLKTKFLVKSKLQLKQIVKPSISLFLLLHSYKSLRGGKYSSTYMSLGRQPFIVMWVCLSKNITNTLNLNKFLFFYFKSLLSVYYTLT